MPTTTSRRILPQPVGLDSPAELRIAATALATAVDQDAIWASGTISARSSLTPIAGTFYYATDTAALSYFNGTAWGALGGVGRQVHSFTTNDNIPPDPSVSILGAFSVSPAVGESVALVGVHIHCVTRGSTPSVFKVQSDHATHGALADVPGLTSLTPNSGAMVAVAATGGPVALALLDRISVICTTPGNSLGCTIAVVTEHTL